ncbi:MAG: PAS domain-containing sensor histidine kinase [Firmicutes bacterium]|nr:PAS domain-containing sensor histidine kinase [Bacillota bacterium]
MTKKIFRSICIVALTVFISSLFLILSFLYGYFNEVQHDQLKIQTDLAARGVDNEGISYFDGLNTNKYRITLVGEDGSVLYDSKSDSSSMENHLEREEVQEAIRSGYGESERFSSTLLEKSLYSAERLRDGSILRLSMIQNSVLTLFLGMLQPICVIIVVALALSLLLASRLSKKIVQPLNCLDLDNPLNNEGYDELSPLLIKLHSQQTQLKRQSNELKKRQDEFNAITDCMNEGLMLLNTKGTILSINHAAVSLLSADNFCIGKNILTVNRSLALQQVLSEAIGGNQAEKVINIHDSYYQVNATPVMSDSAVSGVALLIFDVTEKENSELMRREFTANVSHELRTPLHSISGYAELLKNGMVKSDDVTTVAGKIYDEAQRMVLLVEDIIKLSHLDEGAEDMKKEDTDLYDIVNSAIDRLSDEAKNSGVTVYFKGSHAIINGVPQLLNSIVYNLCDNGIKYNRKGGTLSVELSEEASEIVLKVSDTGIGIPPEHHARIFERFYRVDKSHSKEVGGTGLGLSIVKHAAKIHNAKIQVESVPSRGTSITVRFPR